MPEVHYVPKGCMDVYIGSVCVGGQREVGGGGDLAELPHLFFRDKPLSVALPFS